MAKNAVESTIERLQSQIDDLVRARDAIMACLDEGDEQAPPKPKRTRKRKAGLPAAQEPSL